MKDTSKKKRLVIRLTAEQQADLRKALGTEEVCEFLEIPLPKGTERMISDDSGTVVPEYGIVPPFPPNDHFHHNNPYPEPFIVYGIPFDWGDKDGTVKIIK